LVDAVTDDGDTTMVEALKPAVDALIGIANAYEKTVRSNGQIPAADSPGMRELAEQQRFVNQAWTQPVDNAHSIVSLLTYAAVDHTRGFAHLFAQPPTPTYAHLVLARAALEAFGACSWLCEPNIGTENRLKRSLVIELDDALNRKRYGLPDIRAKGKEILAQIRRGGELTGWTIIANDRQQVVDGVVAPSMGDMIAEAVGSAGVTDPHSGSSTTFKAVWSYLSGVAHGYTFALFQSLMPSETDTPIDGLARMDITTNSLSVHIMGVAVASAATTCIDRVFGLMGWTDPHWSSAKAACQPWFQAVIQAQSQQP
jgi:hypothetical protein